MNPFHCVLLISSQPDGVQNTSETFGRHLGSWNTRAMSVSSVKTIYVYRNHNSLLKYKQVSF